MLNRMMTRRTVALATLIFITVTVLVRAQDWPMINGNMERTSLTTSLTPQPPLEIANRMSNIKATQFSVHQGILYSARGGEPNSVAAVDLETGEDIWGFDIPGSRGANDNIPAISGDLVLFGGQQGSALYAVNRLTGTEAWAIPTRSLYARCIVTDGTAAFVCADSLLCIELPSGAIRWKYPINATITPTLDDESVYLNANNRLWAIDKTSGVLRWNIYAFDRSFSQVVVDGDVLYYTEGDTVRAAHKNDGTVLWQYGVPHVRRLSGLVTGALTLGEGSLCVSVWEDTTETAHIHVLDKSNGTLRWTKQFSGEGVFTPTVVGSSVYIVEYHNHTLWGFNLLTGEELLRRDDASYDGQPVVADGKLFVADGAHMVVFDELSTSVSPPGLTQGLPDLRISPQPVRQHVTVSFTLKRTARVRMELYDLQGCLIAEYSPRACVPGPVHIHWNPQSGRAQRIVPGTYFLHVAAGTEQMTRKILFLGN